MIVELKSMKLHNVGGRSSGQGRRFRLGHRRRNKGRVELYPYRASLLAHRRSHFQFYSVITRKIVRLRLEDAKQKKSFSAFLQVADRIQKPLALQSTLLERAASIS